MLSIANGKEYSMTESEYWTRLGKYFGYPDCCIKDFIKHGSDQTVDQWAVHRGTGFIPCRLHAQDIVEGVYSLESLIQNRQHSLPFPFENKAEKEQFIKQMEEVP